MIQQKIDESYDPEFPIKSGLEQSSSERKVKENRLNDLTGTEWIKDSVSVWFSKGLGKDHKHAP